MKCGPPERVTLAERQIIFRGVLTNAKVIVKLKQFNLPTVVKPKVHMRDII